MKLFVLTFLFLLSICTKVSAQDDPSKTAKAFIQQGDYNNALVVLNRAIQNDKNNVELRNDLAFTYYLQRDFVKAMATGKELVDGKDGDVQSYQILGMVYKAIENRGEAENLYRSALKKFPESGVLYNEYGELIASGNNQKDAIKLWQKGIQLDANYSGNYYNAAKYYLESTDRVWGLIYGEIFINLESYSKRTPEIKSLLLEGYKKLFAETDMTKNQDVKNDFVRQYLITMKNQSPVVSAGITPDALTALRTRFVLEWFSKPGTPIPFRLFDYQKQLAREGIFDAYNQWIFGAASDLTAFQQWTATHSDEYSRFNTFQKNRVFKLPQGQYYQSTK
ncbi:MAG: tetratricopeptide repeat protein [Flavitalea sp.]